MPLSLGAYLLGMAELLACAAALALGASALRRRLLGDWDGPPAVLATSVLAVGLLTAVLLLLGVVGLLEEPVVVPALILAGLIPAAFDLRFLNRRYSGQSTADRGAGVGWGQVALAGVAVGVVVVLWVMPALTSLDRGMYGFDTHWYHMPFAARFAQDGAITALHYTQPAFLNWLYPAGSELIHALPLVVFDRDILSPLINFGWAGMALLAGWCVGRPYNVPGATTLAVSVVLAANLFGDQAGDARNDTMALALLLSAVALMIHARGGLGLRPEEAARFTQPWWGAIAIAGLACGLALGTRLTSLAPVAALTVGVILLAPAGRRRVAALAWFAPMIAISGWWFARNLVLTGNPLPFIEDAGPLDLPGPPVAHGDREPFSVAHYLTDLDVWTEWFVPAFENALGMLWPIVLGLAAIGALAALARRSEPALRVAAAASIVTALAYIVTPVTASGSEGAPVGFEPNLRYLAFGLAIGLALAPIALERVVSRYRPGYVPWAVCGLLAAALAAIALDGERFDEGHVAIAIATGVAVTAALAALAVLARPALTYGAVAAAALVFVAAGHPVQRDYLEGRYANVSGALPYPGLDRAFRFAQGIRNAEIGTTTSRQYPLYGPDFSNQVSFVSVEAGEDDFGRPASCEAWRRALNAGGYDYVLIAPDQLDEDPGGRVERPWTEGDPNAELVFEAGPATIFRLTGPLDEKACR